MQKKNAVYNSNKNFKAPMIKTIQNVQDINIGKTEDAKNKFSINGEM